MFIQLTDTGGKAIYVFKAHIAAIYARYDKLYTIIHMSSGQYFEVAEPLDQVMGMLP